MAEKHFTHLHLHSEFSLLDGAISLDKLIEFGKVNGLKALAITDHGNIFGAVKFFQKCKSAGIKPILGIEAYLTEDINIKSIEKKYYHLILLVQNEIGYKNLCKLISFSFQKGFYFKPRIDYKILKEHSEGLIATTACLGGHIPNLLMQNNFQEAEKYIDWFIENFGRERFYFEIQPEDQEEQKKLNKLLFEWSKKKEIECIVTGDCHYAQEEDHDAHEVMLSIQTRNKLDDPNRYTFGDCRTFIRTKEQLLQEFKEHPEIIWNSGKVADMCNFDFETGKLFFPKFEVPENFTPETYFKHLCFEGFKDLIQQKRIPADKKGIYEERLNEEVTLITEMGFVGYFLIVSDFIQWSKRNGIPVGPGRGSAAGSLVAWTLEITNIDPIKYNLLFERFLNPERVTMPDIDIDFCIEGRENVIQYIRNKYGHEKVGQIITFGTMMAKGVIKDVARVLGFPFEDANSLTDLIPDQLKISLNEAIEQEPKLQEMINSNPKVARLFDIAKRLEGLTRHASKHAAGIVISPEPIDQVLPVYVPPKSTELVTQYAMTELEAIGFLKIDLLGLKNLTLIKNVLSAIKNNYGIEINIDNIALDDTKTFELICAGKTSGVFQLESEGLKDVLRRLKPEKFEDIIAVNALYRPGPLGSGMVDDFIERRHGKAEINYFFDELEPILKETYGVIVYQEQVMKIASTIAGYTLGESDILRRAMGKKKVDVMAQQRELFISRAEKNNFDKSKAGKLFDLMAYFAGYGFNKSHSAAYALIAYQTAFLKANYPAEFMAALISLESAHAEKMVFYIDEAKEMQIPIAPPNINESEINFTVKNDKIVFGLLGIKNVGLASLENIIEERSKKPFFDILDFCTRIDLRTTNKRVLENLIYAGAFDTLPGNRAQQFEEISKILDLATQKKESLLTGQMGLFSSFKKESTQEFYQFQPKDEWKIREKLEKEKQAIGFYLSSHPLDSYKKYIKWLKIKTFTEILNSIIDKPTEKEETIISLAIIKNKKIITTKKGDPMAFVQVEDKSSVAEIILFPKLFKRIQDWLNNHDVFILKGQVDNNSIQKCKIIANDFVPVDLFFENIHIQKLSLKTPSNFDSNSISEVKSIFNKKGKTALHFIFQEQNKTLKLQTKNSINLDLENLEKIKKLNFEIEINI
jgi:DNA polymerase III subunit alpha